MSSNNLEKTVTDLITKDLWSEWISTRYMLRIVTPPIVKVGVTVAYYTPDEVTAYATSHVAGVGYVENAPTIEATTPYTDGFDFYKFEGNLK